MADPDFFDTPRSTSQCSHCGAGVDKRPTRRVLLWACLLGCSATHACVGRYVDYLSEGALKAVCEPGWYARRTGEACGKDYEPVVLEGCHWHGWHDGHDGDISGEVSVYMPHDPKSCDVRTQAGELCFEESRGRSGPALWQPFPASGAAKPVITALC